MNAKTLNYALNLALEWGENFHKPIQERLRAAFPALTRGEADDFDGICRDIVKSAFEQMERAYLKEITQEEATAEIIAHNPLINSENMAQLWAQGQYYAWHDNG